MRKKIYIKELSKEWLNYKKLVVKYSTITKYESIIECHLKYIDIEKPISSWREKDFQKWYCNFSKESKLSKSTHNMINIILKDILNFGVKKYGFEKCDLSFMKKVKEKKEIHTLTNEEYQRLSNYCKANINPTTVSVYTSLHTGLRIGEICGLKWEDIHLEKQMLFVNKTVQRIKNSDPNGPKSIKMISSPKSLSSARIVVLADFLVEYLKIYKTIYNPKTNDDFFVTNSSNIPEERNIQRNFKKICNKLDISLKFHGLRHSFATNCVECAMDIKTLSELLGHSNTSITMDLYVHPSLSYKKEQINKISKFGS